MSTYKVYVSHHAGAGGVAARVLQLMLEKTIGENIFYDIDNVQNSTAMNDAIKVSKNLLVLLGSETFCRTWCIGAIVVAFRNSVPMQSVIFTDLRETDTNAKGYLKKSFTASTGKTKK